jgi:hypothetical protein
LKIPDWIVVASCSVASKIDKLLADRLWNNKSRNEVAADVANAIVEAFNETHYKIEDVREGGDDDYPRFLSTKDGEVIIWVDEDMRTQICVYDAQFERRRPLTNAEAKHILALVDGGISIELMRKRIFEELRQTS